MIANGLVLAALFLALLWWFNAVKTGAPTITSAPRIRRRIVEILKSELARRGADSPFTVVDLGSGSGQLCIQIARTLPDAKVLGIELTLLPWLCSLGRHKLFRVRNLSFIRADFWKFDLSAADAVVMYLDNDLPQKLGERFHTELKSGALIICNELPLGSGWDPIETYPFRLLFGLIPVQVTVYRTE